MKLDKNGIEVELYTTIKPDIVFQINGKKYAIEVETGSMLGQKKIFLEKIKTLNKNYDKWFFVVTNRNKVTDYKNYGDTVDIRFVKRKLKNVTRDNRTLSRQ